MNVLQFKNKLMAMLISISFIAGFITLPANAENTQPLTVIHGRNIGMTMQYYGKDSSDAGPDLYYGTVGNDKKKAISHTYDKETGVMQLELVTPIELVNLGSGYFTIKLGYKQLVRKTPYIAVGMYFYDPENPDGVNVSTSINLNDNVLWGRSKSYTPTLTNHVIDATAYTGGKNGGYSKTKETSEYDYIKISTPAADKGDADKVYKGRFIPQGTKVGIQYVAFFDSLEAAQNYEYNFEKEETHQEYLDDNKLRVMSYNVRTAYTPTDMLYVRDRVQYMRALIEQKKPDIIGFQEFDSEWQKGIVQWANNTYVDQNGKAIYDNTYNYRPYNFNTTNEGDGIFWNVNKFDIIDSGFNFLPYPDEKFVDPIGNFQGMNWVKLRVKDTGKVFYYINTHLSLDIPTRLKQCQVLVDICSADEPIYDSVDVCNDAPIVMTGDFNTIWDMIDYTVLTTYFEDVNRDKNTYQTLNNCWVQGPYNAPIDFCLYTPDNVVPISYEVVDDVAYDTDTSDNTTSSNTFELIPDCPWPTVKGTNYKFISDHFGIMGEVALAGGECDFTEEVPIIGISSETDYATEDDTIKVTATVETHNNSAENVKFYVDDKEFEGEAVVKNANIYSDYIKDYTISISGLKAGIHTIKAVAENSSGNKAEDSINIEIINAFEATFVSNTFAYEDESFPLSVTFATEDIKAVAFELNGVEYPAQKDEEGVWSSLVSGGIPVGKYELKVKVTNSKDKTVSSNQLFYILPYGDKLLKSSYAFKHQSSDGKLWSVGEANNYDLKYVSGVKDVLYSAIDVSSIIPVAAKSIKLVTSTKSNGANGWTRFNINAVEPFTSSTIKNSDGTPKTIPALGQLIANAVYTQAKVGTDSTLYNYYLENIPVKDNTDRHYMEFDVTDFMKEYIENGNDKLYIRTSVVNNNPTDTYGMATNNALVYMFVEYEQPKASFVSNSLAYENEAFPVAVKTVTQNVENVSFLVNGSQYSASQNSDGIWHAYIEQGLPEGEYQIEAAVTNPDGKTSSSYQKLTVLKSDSKIITPTYSAKLQSSDGKIWKVLEKNDYRLLYQNNEIKDVLYTSINLSSLKNADIIESAYLVTSTKSGSGQGANGWTKFKFMECDAFTTSTLVGGQTPEKLPTLGDVIIEKTFTDVDINSKDEDYNIISKNVQTNGTANYMKLDITEYLKGKIQNGETAMYFRTSVGPTGTDSFANATNNSLVKLLVKFANPATVDNFDGTYGYVVDSADYVGDGSVTAIISEYAEDGGLVSLDSFDTFSGRKMYRISSEDEKYLMVWDGISSMKPLGEKVKIAK